MFLSVTLRSEKLIMSPFSFRLDAMAFRIKQLVLLWIHYKRSLQLEQHMVPSDCILFFLLVSSPKRSSWMFCSISFCIKVVVAHLVPNTGTEEVEKT